MKYILLILTASSLILSGCAKEETSTNNATPEIVKVENAAVLDSVGDDGDFGLFLSSDPALTKILKIQNNGDASTSESVSASISGDPAFRIILQQGCSILAKTKVCTVRVAFDPKNKQPNTYTATLRFGTTPLMEIPLTAEVEAASTTGGSPAVAAFYDAATLLSGSLDMGDFSGTQSSQKIITIKNDTASALPLTSATVSNTTQFSVVNQCLNKTLNPGASCSVRLTFSAAGKPAGVYTNTITFGSASLSVTAESVVSSGTTSAGGGNVIISFLEGTNNAANPLDLGVVSGSNVSSLKIINIKNTGTAPMTVSSSATLTGDPEIKFVLNSCLNKTLLMGQSCSVRLAIGGAGSTSGVKNSVLSFSGAELPVTGSVFSTYRVTVSANTRVNVSDAAGLSCGNGGSICIKDVAAASSIILTATPALGYEVTSWNVPASCSPMSGAPSPVLCNVNSNLNIPAPVTGCAGGYVLVGGVCQAQTITYEAVFGDYGSCLKDGNLILACDGQGVQTRSITACNKFVGGNPAGQGTLADCAAFDVPSYTQLPCASPAGEKINSIDNGSITVSCLAGSTTENFVSISCDPEHYSSGQTCLPDVITYEAVFSDYGACLKDGNPILACDGEGIQTRTLDTCNKFRNGNPDGQGSLSDCSAYDIPAYTELGCLSPSGDKIVSIDNGDITYSCAEGSTVENFSSIACDVDYHSEGQLCFSNTRSCSPAELAFLDLEATEGQATWNGSSYDCSISQCIVDYHVFNNQCDPDRINCTPSIANATLAEQVWNGSSYDACTVSQCEVTHHISGNSCDANVIACSPMPEGALVAQQTWDGSQYGTCTISTCDSANSYYLNNNSCEKTQQLVDLNTAFVTSCTLNGVDITFPYYTTQTTCEQVKDLMWFSSAPACAGKGQAACVATEGCGWFPGTPGSCFENASANMCWDVVYDGPIDNEFQTNQANCYDRPGVWNNGPNTLDLSPNSFFRASNGDVYFKGTDGSNTSLYKTDGTKAGTIKLAIASSSAFNDFKFFAEFGGKVYFNYTDSAGTELWETNGTLMGTRMVQDFCTTPAPSCSSSPVPFATSDRLYVFVRNNAGGYAGVYSSTTPSNGGSYSLVLNSATNFTVTDSTNFFNTVVTKDIVFFTGTQVSPATGVELLKLQGGAISLVRDVISGSTGSLTAAAKPIVLDYTNNRIIVAMRDTATDNTGTKIYVSDGTSAGTTKIYDMTTTGTYNGNLLSYSYDKKYMSSTYLYQVLSTSTHGSELFRILKASPYTVSLVRDIRPSTSGSLPTIYGQIGNYIIFSANDGTNGSELWYSDVTNTTNTNMFTGAITTASSSSSNFPIISGQMANNFSEIVNPIVNGKFYQSVNNRLYEINPNLSYSQITLPDTVPFNFSSVVWPVGDPLKNILLMKYDSPTKGEEIYLYKF